MNYVEGKLPGNYSHEEKVEALWHDKNWQECLEHAEIEIHHGFDENGKDTGRRTLQNVSPGTYEKRARELMRERGFKS